MADPNSKTKGNVAGKYYVDTNCIACDACILAAEKHFKIDTSVEPAFAFVSKQPETSEEEEACQEAMESCPVEAIGDDGQ
ncbi:MAG: ferredoxin [Bdellovibrionales bacterium]|nr:ferredoxin [Bdellovibrionales bacterium]